MSQPRHRLDRLLVTRPAPEADAWALALCEAGWPAQALPLIQIAEPGTPDEREGLRHWRAHWHEADAILFVSGAAVARFFAEGVEPPRGAAGRTRFWAPGPGTARQLAEALEPLGIDAGRIDAPDADAAQFDSEHLWPRVAAQVGPGRRVLIVRGASSRRTEAASDAGVAGNGRDWLIRQCLAAGARVEGCVAYARRASELSAAQEALARSAARPGSVWLFSSSEALAPLRALVPAPDWTAAHAVVTHPRIGAAAHLAGFRNVVFTRPTLPDVLSALESVWYRP